MQFVTAPDFPTGGQVMGRQGIIDAYTTGRGSIRLRGTAEIEEGARQDQIVITALPYQASPSALLAKVSDLVKSGELTGIAEANDESAQDKMRIVLKLKRDAAALVILNNLYKRTPLQTNFAVNMVALVDGIPRTLNLRRRAGGVHRASGAGDHPSVRVSAPQTRGAGAHHRGPAQGARHARRGHRHDPRLG